MLKGILIDMGDTLIHNLNFNFKSALNALYSQVKNPSISLDEFHRYADLVREETFAKRDTIEINCLDYLRLLKTRFGLDISMTDEELEDFFGDHLCDSQLVDNVVQILEHFQKKKYKVVVLSNTMFSSRAIKKRLGFLNKYFSDVIASGDFVVRKPDKAFFELGLGILNLSKEEVVYIGNDYYYDIYGANQAGIKAVWLNENNLPVNNNYSTNDYLEINNYQQLIDFDF